MKKIKALIQKILSNREMVRYLVIGVLSTVVNYVVYVGATRLFHVDELTSNWIAWIAAVVFAYVTNKLYVFESHVHGFRPLMLEIFNFMAARVFSLVMEQALMWLLVKQMGLYDLACKLGVNVLVVIVNYIFSKFFIFRKH